MQPILIFDTNILIDVWLGRNNYQAVLLVKLAEAGQVELHIPEYVLLEFRGTALRLVREARDRLNQQIRPVANDWRRSAVLAEGAEQIREGAELVQDRLEDIRTKVDDLVKKIEGIARVSPHSQDVHLRGDLRFLSGRPPDRPVDGLKDCRIYEAILDIARSVADRKVPKFVVTSDNDFDYDELRAELRALGFDLRKDAGRLYGELRK